MQVAIGGIMATVSEDGRDIQLPAPAGTGRAIVLPFPNAPHAKPTESVASLVAPATSPDEHVSAVTLDGTAAAVLIFCVAVAIVAVVRFVGRAGIGRDEAPSRLYEPLDDAAFLKRYGRTP